MRKYQTKAGEKSPPVRSRSGDCDRTKVAGAAEMDAPDQLAVPVPSGLSGESASLAERSASGLPQSARSILQSQRSYGNRYVQRALQLDRQAEGENEVSPEAESAIERSRGGGQALDHSVRRPMEQAFGTDFGTVRIHTGAEAHSLNHAVNAIAFTTGQDIFFRDGAYNPGSSEGRETLAHELTHVVQQRSMNTDGPLKMGAPDDEYEQEADRTASQVNRVLRERGDESGGTSTVGRDQNHFHSTLLRQSDDPTDSSGSSDASTQSGPVEQSYPLATPEAISIAEEDLPSGPGDYNVPDNSNVAMAKRADANSVIQRDDDTPHAGGDVQGGYTAPVYTPPGGHAPAPWSLQGTLVYRNFNIRTLQSLHLDLGHEPNFSLTIDSTGVLTDQFAITLVNWHWMAPWSREVEIGLQSFVNNFLQPSKSLGVGGQAQVEAHIVPWLSITLNANGTYTLPRSGQNGQFAVTGGAGVLFHAEF